MRDRLLACLLASVALFNVADYAFTLRAVYILQKPEANPLINAALGTPWFAVVKVLLVPLACWLIWHSRRRWRKAKPLIHAGVLVLFVAYGWLTLYHAYWQLRL